MERQPSPATPFSPTTLYKGGTWIPQAFKKQATI